MRFTKMQALGNDFVALNGFRLSPHDWQALSISLCDRHFGIGADGLFVALPSASADARMLFFNPDGTEDRCGNGLRCFGRFLHDEGITDRTALHVETFGGTVALLMEDRHGSVGYVTVDLGPPVLEPALIPLRWDASPALDVPVEAAGRVWHATVLSSGTPHAVIVVDALPDEGTFQAASPLIEQSPLFPEKTSVMWTHFVSRERAQVRIWERATGETLGCGTGAAAVVVAGQLRGLCEHTVVVASKGGEAIASLDESGSVGLTGPAYVVYTADWGGPLP